MELDSKHRFIHEVLFAGLRNWNTGFDSPLIPHVSPEDFLVVLDCCAETGASICGVEIFDVRRWQRDHEVDFLGVWFPLEEGLDWVRRLVQEYAGQTSITVYATFYTPEEERDNRDNPDWNNGDIDLNDALGGASV